MKSSLAVVAVTVTVALAGCGDRTGAQKSPSADTTPPSSSSAAVAVTRSNATPTGAPPERDDATPVSTDHPDFAEVYPGARVEGAPVSAGGPSGPGGLVSFTTDATPETVIAFYRDRAEASGLSPMSALNQGDTRGYAAIRQDTGASVNVVASPVAGAGTSVQLTWSAGQ